MISRLVTQLNLNMYKSKYLSIILLVVLAISTPASAQGSTPPPATTPMPQQTPSPQATPVSGPTYIVASGDSLTLIANRFGVKLDDLMSANGITDPNQIFIGQPLIIPGLEGISGILVTELIAYGETLRSISRQHQVSEELLRRLNKVTSPAELYAGVGFVLPKPEEAQQLLSTRSSLDSGESLLELSIRQGTSPWTLTQQNSLAGTWDGIPGEVLFGASGTSEPIASGLPPVFQNVELRDAPFKQGGTAEITVLTDPDVQLSGTLVDKPLNFFPGENGTQVALQGIHAMLTPGPYPLQLIATLPDGSKQTYEQNVLIRSGFYPNDPVLIVDPSFIDPAVTEPENEQVASIVATTSPTKYWSGIFTSPAAFPDCFTSRFGNRRAYNNNDFIYFHTGLDFCGGEGLPITAPADGVVVFAGPLTVRGNATIIDHGHGVFTGYWHQSEIFVKEGEKVTRGQQIGLVGGTGRVTGAHQHFEVWVNGIQVDPIDWLTNIYP
jgi:murein DD-endopeptidase MepM/ murein hydrolase activator NlpD